jgi:hypothetical protein
VSRRAWGKQTALYALSSLVACFATTLVGCGGEDTPVVTEEAKQKQAVVQDKMKEFMQEKMKNKGARK